MIVVMVMVIVIVMVVVMDMVMIYGTLFLHMVMGHSILLKV